MYVAITLLNCLHFCDGLNALEIPAMLVFPFSDMFFSITSVCHVIFMFFHDLIVFIFV